MIYKRRVASFDFILKFGRCTRMTTCCLNWEDYRTCDLEIGGSHLVGGEARPEDGFYESRWEYEEKEKKSGDTTETARPGASTNEKGMEN